MIHTIENDFLICEVESTGAEIRSLKNKKTGQEYIWPMNPEIWASSSPVLFPAVGTVRESTVIHKGLPFALPKHGIIRNNSNLEFRQLSKEQVLFSLQNSPQIKQQYPFNFRFEVYYQLIDKRLQMRFVVGNTGMETMHFNAGGHTAYYCPLDSAMLSDYVIDMPTSQDLKAETIDPETMLLGYEQRPIELNNGSLVLGEDLFKRDALIFADVDFDRVRLRHKDADKGLEVHFRGFPHLALWAKPGADYVCIEPWLGLPDRVDAPLTSSEKTNYQSLSAGQKLELLIETVV